MAGSGAGTVSAQGSDVPLPRMATPGEPSVSSPPAAADSRSRDALRSRDR